MFCQQYVREHTIQFKTIIPKYHSRGNEKGGKITNVSAAFAGQYKTICIMEIDVTLLSAMLTLSATWCNFKELRTSHATCQCVSYGITIRNDFSGHELTCFTPYNF